MKPWVVIFGFCGATLLACASEPVEYVELEQVCGGPSPLRVLELEPDEMVRSGETLRVQDRVLYVVRKFDENDADTLNAVTTGSAVWATGPCGESPVQVGAGINKIFTLEVWPDVVLGCEEATGNVVVLDPTGAQEPHVVFPAVAQNWFGCGLNWTDYGLLSLEEHDEELGALLFHPYPSDPRTETSAPVVLLDPIRIGPSNSSGPGFRGNVLFSYPDEVLALTPEDELVRVDLADGAVTTLQTAVAGFSASRDGAYVLWQDATVTGGDPEFPEGKILLRDRAVGSDALLAEAALRNSGLPLFKVDRGIVELTRAGPKDATRIFFLPDLDFVDLESGLILNFQLADGRWMGFTFFSSYLDAIDLRSNERTRLFPREAQVLRHDEVALQVLEVPLCCINSSRRTEGPIWRVPLDGSAMTRLADRATSLFEQLGDGRLLGPVGVNAAWLAALVLVEPETRDELRVDDRVHAYSIDATQDTDEGVISYSVADGDRSGVYLARLPAAESSRVARGEMVEVEGLRGSDLRR